MTNSESNTASASLIESTLKIYMRHQQILQYLEYSIFSRLPCHKYDYTQTRTEKQLNKEVERKDIVITIDETNTKAQLTNCNKFEQGMGLHVQLDLIKQMKIR